MNKMKKKIGIFDTSANKSKIENLETQGYEVFRLPTLEIVENDLALQINNFKNLISENDWLIFSDIFTVDIVVNRLAENKFDIYELDQVRICTLGEAVADRLRFSQVHSDVIPGKLNPNRIISDLLSYIASDNEMKGSSFTIFEGKDRKNGIFEEFEKANINAKQILIYDTVIVNGIEASRIKLLIENGAVDEVILFSVEELEYFRILLDLNGLNEISELVQISSTDEIVLKSIDELSF